ncbi:hypothetical protein PHYBOEH_003934 [Phytophthora boehmeriae]|uniref:Uncharacterized protein n=1 Tax=Phytophthora boehmeriae TaxID=109152 RepID=A0A8T1WTV3_9STRA|nr:hypothetical protein PHYBOEH_003934 [Phytophthora boehmeriae]
MGNKSSVPYATPYSRPSGSLSSASAVSRTTNPNYGAPSPAERGMLYGKTKNITPAPTPSALYSKQSKSKTTAPTPKSLYSKTTPNSTPVPTPSSLYSKKTKGSAGRGFLRSSFSRSGASIGQPSPYGMSGASASSAQSRTTVMSNATVAQMAMTSCVKCRMPFGDSTAAFCRDCGHPRPAGSVPVIATVHRVNEDRSSFGKLAVAF